MAVIDDVRLFAARHGKTLTVNDLDWRYYCAGDGPPILWLTGGLRRAALGYAFMERLAAHHTVIAPDYPPVQRVGEFITAFDAILRAEGVGTFALGGQSYGGLLAQAYLAHRPREVEKLILSSTGPADYAAAWLPVEYIAVGMARVLPERSIKGLLAGGLLKFITLPDAERLEWQAAIREVLDRELTRWDVVSHFAVAADLIRKRIVRRTAYREWTGSVFVMSAENDRTQSKSDIPRYTRLFGRPVEVIEMGNMGHAAALFDPEAYVALLEQALA